MNLSSQIAIKVSRYLFSILVLIANRSVTKCLCPHPGQGTPILNGIVLNRWSPEWCAKTIPWGTGKNIANLFIFLFYLLIFTFVYIFNIHNTVVK